MISAREAKELALKEENWLGTVLQELGLETNVSNITPFYPGDVIECYTIHFDNTYYICSLKAHTGGGFCLCYYTKNRFKNLTFIVRSAHGISSKLTSTQYYSDASLEWNELKNVLNFLKNVQRI